MIVPVQEGATQTPAPPAPPAPVAVQSPAEAGTRFVTLQNNSPSAIYEAFRNQRRELYNQRERLQDRREEITDELREALTAGNVGPNTQGLEAQLVATDARLASLDAQIAESEAAVARAAAVPGAIVPDPPRPPESGPPDEFWVLSGIFMFVVLLPLTIAYSRRIWRRGAAIVTQFPQEVVDRFTRIEHGLESVAVEVERIGEGQRFLTRMYAERGLGAGPAQPVEVRQAAGEKHRVP